MSNITSIRPIETITKIDHYQGDLDDMPCEGYKITTDQQEILLVIDSDQQCCESWGYLMSEDNLDEFVRANLLGLRIVDTDSATVLEATWDDNEEVNDGRYDNTMFVNIETSKGTLQFTAYNNHNGYYGHTARIVSQQLTYQEML